MKSKVILILIFLFLFLPKQKAYAVIKTSGPLEVTTDEPLFPSSIVWYPGLSVTKSFIVKNKSVDSHTVIMQATNTSDTDDISKVYFFQVAQNGTVLFGESGSKTLKNFWDAGEINLKDIGRDGEKLFDLTVFLPANAGNEFQNKSAKFDLVIGFQGTDNQVTITNSTSNSSTTGAGGTVAGVSTGFTELFSGQSSEVLGATASPEIVNVLGTKTSWWQKYWWILPLIIFGCLLLWWFLGKMRGLLHSDN